LHQLRHQVQSVIKKQIYHRLFTVLYCII